MNKIRITAVLLMLAAPLSAQAEGVKIAPISKTDVTSSGQPIVLPQGPVKVITSTYEIPPGASTGEVIAQLSRQRLRARRANEERRARKAADDLDL